MVMSELHPCAFGFISLTIQTTLYHINNQLNHPNKHNNESVLFRFERFLFLWHPSTRGMLLMVDTHKRGEHIDYRLWIRVVGGSFNSPVDIPKKGLGNGACARPSRNCRARAKQTCALPSCWLGSGAEVSALWGTREERSRGGSVAENSGFSY